MSNSSEKWFVWAALSCTAFLGTAGSLANFWAAADLGYDAKPNGYSVLAGWGYAMLGLAACGIVTATLAIKSWLSRRKNPF
jgi:hypothetical protein